MFGNLQWSQTYAERCLFQGLPVRTKPVCPASFLPQLSPKWPTVSPEKRSSLNPLCLFQPLCSCVASTGQNCNHSTTAGYKYAEEVILCAHTIEEIYKLVMQQKGSSWDLEQTCPLSGTTSGSMSGLVLCMCKDSIWLVCTGFSIHYIELGHSD